MNLTIGFGSRTRGDHDVSSDRDILVISDFVRGTGPSTDHNGSISEFASPTAIFLATHGSLFFKHIIDEGKLLEGSPRDFLKLRSAWRPARDYDSEIESNLDVLELIRFTPRSPRGVSVVADMLVSTIRNVLIRRFANDGVFIFSWCGLLVHARRRNWLRDKATDLIVQARIIKNSYRKSRRALTELSFVNRLADLTRDVTHGGCPQLGFASRQTISRLPARQKSGSYKQLRAAEYLCAEYAGDTALKDLEELTKSPNHFAKQVSPQSLSSITAHY